MKKVILVLLLGLITFSAACSAPQSTETGVLQGHVSIGPLIPVEQVGVPYITPCEVFIVRKILVYDESGKKLLKTLNIDCDGIYATELAAGKYTIDINKAGIDSSGQLPAIIEIKFGQTVTLDIDIDTGIR